MSSQTFIKRIDGEPVTIKLMSLADYEAAGGVYSDAGNGGETVSADQFVGAAYVEEDGGYDLPAIAEAIGADGAWFDSTLVNTMLLTDWPAEAPYSARFVND